MLLTDQHEALRDEVKRLMRQRGDSVALRRSIESGAGCDLGLWNTISQEMGLTGIGLAESDGGVGGTWIDLVIILGELGYALAHVPFLTSVAFVSPIVQACPAGNSRRDLLKAIAVGEPAAVVDKQHSRLTATSAGPDWKLDGVANHVIDGAIADHLLVVADSADGPLLLWVRSSAVGVHRQVVDTFDLTRPQATVTFGGAHAVPLAVGDDAVVAVDHGRDRAMLGLAAEQLGIARRCLDMACEHARVRHQFGKAIGSFQAIKHRLADLLVEVESADAAVYNAAWAVYDQCGVPIAVSIARTFASDTAVRAAGESLHIHGGMGFTWEHDAHLLLRRAKTSQYLHGNPADGREELARRAGFSGDGPVGSPNLNTVDAREPVVISESGSESDTAAALAAVRHRVRQFLAQYLPTNWRGIGSLNDGPREEFLRDWRRALQQQRFLAYSWPAEYGGGGGTALEEAVIHEECHRAGLSVWNGNDHLSIQMLGNTLLTSGSEEQRRAFLPRVLDGSDLWCQGYSEPGAGSDLASLRCQATIEGDEWVVTGQKIWTSDAPNCNWIFVLVRTDQDAPKHKGISFLLVPMDQPGVTVRPIRNISGSAHFAEVFFDGARTSAVNVVGPVNEGWRTAMKLVEFERGAEAGMLHLMFHDEFVRLIELARGNGRIADPLLRQRLAWAYSKIEILKFMGARTVAALQQGRSPGAQAAITKLYWSEYHAEVTDIAMDVLGGAASTPSGRTSRNVVRTDEPGAPNSSLSWTDVYLKARAGTIYAGTSEIQRTTIAERVLGLPK